MKSIAPLDSDLNVATREVSPTLKLLSPTPLEPFGVLARADRRALLSQIEFLARQFLIGFLPTPP
jgi:hypothetical protein